jgi:SnoaL-like polyketide cyclase
MTTAKALYQRWIDELWTGKSVAAELVSDDFVGHWPDREVRGPGELQEIVDETQKMFSDLMFVIDVEPFVERDMMAARWTALGRRRRVRRGSPATTSCGSPTTDSSSIGRAPPPGKRQRSLTGFGRQLIFTA